jgi:hypothetical protein
MFNTFEYGTIKHFDHAKSGCGKSLMDDDTLLALFDEYSIISRINDDIILIILAIKIMARGI